MVAICHQRQKERPVLRFMFINNSNTDQVIEIKTGERIIMYALATTTPNNQPEQERGRPMSKRLRLTLPGDGEIYGFVTDERVEYVNPDPSLVAVYSVSNKDPWPPPPPPTTHYQTLAATDFKTRWNNFLLALGVAPSSYDVVDRSIKVRVEQ
ncbi:MAG: hypothetical protein WKG01_23745 [Kofleriaceae bacterium]